MPLLDEAIALLPERYRAVVVVCDPGGATRAEAAPPRTARRESGMVVFGGWSFAGAG